MSVELPEDFFNSMAAYIGIADKTYDAVVVLDARETPPRPYVFSLDCAIAQIEGHGIRPLDGMVYLIKADSAWQAFKNKELWTE